MSDEPTVEQIAQPIVSVLQKTVLQAPRLWAYEAATAIHTTFIRPLTQRAERAERERDENRRLLNEWSAEYDRWVNKNISQSAYGKERFLIPHRDVLEAENVDLRAQLATAQQAREEAEKDAEELNRALGVEVEAVAEARARIATLEAENAASAKLLPETWYADRPFEERLRRFVENWQKVMVSVEQYEAQIMRQHDENAASARLVEALRGALEMLARRAGTACPDDPGGHDSLCEGEHIAPGMETPCDCEARNTAVSAALALTPASLPAEAPAGRLFVTGDFRLHSGARSDVKIDCDALTDGDLATLARMASRVLPRFGSVEGVPSGGLRLAEALRPYALGGPLLIVDDVLTTGGSMEAHRAGRDAIGLVIFARAVAPAWVTPLFTLRTAEVAGEKCGALIDFREPAFTCRLTPGHAGQHSIRAGRTEA